MHIFLVEPRAEGRVSGGYLYNQRLGEHAPSVKVVATPPSSLTSTLEALAVEPGDVVLADSLFLSESEIGHFLALRRRSPVVLGVLVHALPSFVERASVRSELAHSLPLTPTGLELALMAMLDLVVTPGRVMATLLSSAGNRVPCVVCPPGVDPAPERHKDLGRRLERVRLIQLGNLGPAKGASDALQALAGLRGTAFELVIVGPSDRFGEHAAQLRSLVRTLGLQERVRFTGKLPHDHALAELHSSDILLIPSYTENCPLVVLEALAAGIPVVGYEVGDVPLLVEHEKSGLLAPLLDVRALSQALGRLLRRPDERRRLAAGAREAGRALPTVAAAAKAFVSAVRSEVDRRPARVARASASPN
jgi:glycosyltransferase involved in cell wall biosynthesis